MSSGRKLLVLAGILAVTATLAAAAVMTFNTSTREASQPGLQTSTGGDLSLPAQPSAVPSSELPGGNTPGTESGPSANGSGTPVFIPGPTATTTPSTGSQAAATASTPAAAASGSGVKRPTSVQNPANARNPATVQKPTSGKPASGVVTTTVKPSRPAVRDPFAAQQGLGDPAAEATAPASTSSAAPVVMRSPRPVNSYPAPLPMPAIVPTSVPAPVAVTQAPVQSVRVPAATAVPMTPAAPVQVQQMPSAPPMSITALPQFPSPVSTPQAVLIPAPKPVHVNQAQAAVRQIGLSLSGTHKTGSTNVGLLTTTAGGYQEVSAGDALPELNATVTTVTASSLTLKVGKDSVKLTLGEPQK